MEITAPTKPVFNISLMVEDMTAKGWQNRDLARRARVSDMTVTRFLRGEFQTARTAKKLAGALGRSVRRYLVTTEAAA
jgi:transcriptional regulator with XRE-family HTH domain